MEFAYSFTLSRNLTKFPNEGYEKEGYVDQLNSIVCIWAKRAAVCVGGAEL